jgi:PKD repeat protein
MPTVVEGDFYIKVTYYTPGFDAPVPIETQKKDPSDTSKYMANPVIQPSGKQWVIDNEGNWQPLGSDIPHWNANLVINAYARYSLGPKANFEMNKYDVCLNSTITFTDASDGDITDYSWDFGADAIPATAIGKGPHTVTFTSSALTGLRNAKLKITGPNGTDSISKEYKVTDKPMMQVAFPDVIRTNDTVQLTAVGDADSYSWFPATNLNMSTGRQVYFTDSVPGLDRIKVTGIQGDCASTGIVELVLKKPPVNDNMCDAIELHIGDNGPFTNSYATVQPNEPYPDETNCNAPLQWCSEGGLQNSVWFKFVGPSSGYVSFDTRGFDTQIAIYNSSSCSNIKKEDLIAANDDYHTELPNSAALNSVPLTPGQTYWIQIDGSSGGDSGVFYITISEFPLDIKHNRIAKTELTVIPNPNNGIANLIYSSPYNEAISIKLYDLTGKILLNQPIRKNEQDLIYPLHLTGLPKGLYYINLSSNKTSQTTKFVIQK